MRFNAEKSVYKKLINRVPTHFKMVEYTKTRKFSNNENIFKKTI